MKPNTLEFSYDMLAELAALIAQLNKQGVPYYLRKDNHAIEITISVGY